MANEWAYVSDYKNIYQISNDGLVKSLNREVELPNGRTRKVKERLLTPKNNGSDYLFVSLSKRGKSKSFYIHRLVASAFVENPEDNEIVNHKDGNPQNNHFENLEWVTHKQNCKHAYDKDLNSNKGKNHGFAVGVIDNELGMKFDTVKEWAEARGINYNTGRNLLNGYSSSKNIEKGKIIKLSKGINGETENTK